MTRRVLDVLSATALALGAAGAAGAQRSACPGLPARAPTPVDTAALEGLAGTYDLVLVDTAPGYGGGRRSGRLRLMRLDSADRYAVRRGLSAPRRVWRPLAGRYTWGGGTPPAWDSVEVTAMSARIGCFGGCFDGSHTSLSIRGVSAAGFVGTWYGTINHVAIPVDRRGRPLPPPGGYFCARRSDG
jgi:hypothetical protein